MGPADMETRSRARPSRPPRSRSSTSSRDNVVLRGDDPGARFAVEMPKPRRAHDRARSSVQAFLPKSFDGPSNATRQTASITPVEGAEQVMAPVGGAAPLLLVGLLFHVVYLVSSASSPRFRAKRSRAHPSLLSLRRLLRQSRRTRRPALLAPATSRWRELRGGQADGPRRQSRPHRR